MSLHGFLWRRSKHMSDGNKENKVENKKELGFLHKVCKGVNHTALSYWIENEDFAYEIRKLMESSVCINTKLVFDIMRNIYIKYDKVRHESPAKPDFNFYLARRAIESLWFSMTGNKTGWR